MLFEDATPEPDTFYHSILLLVMLDSKNSDNNRFPMKLSKAINFLSGTVAHLVFFFSSVHFLLSLFVEGFRLLFGFNFISLAPLSLSTFFLIFIQIIFGFLRLAPAAT